MTNPLPRSTPTAEQLTHLGRLSTGIVASAIEACDVRLPNTGFTNSSIRCIFENLPPIAGYAATARIRTAAPPMEGGRYLYARTDWWEHLLNLPAPRIMVIEDLDNPPGAGAFVGEVHTSILKALGCVGLVTNGAVRDLHEVRGRGFQMFAGNVSVSHAYAHIFDFDGPVQIGGLKIRPGDLIHGDVNGVLNVPVEILDKVLVTAEEIVHKRQAVTSLCSASEFDIAKLREHLKNDVPPGKNSK